MKFTISSIALLAVASAMPQQRQAAAVGMTQNKALAEASAKIQAKLENFFQPYVADYQESANKVQHSMISIYDNDMSAVSKAEAIKNLMQEQLDSNNVNVNLAAHQSNANSKINAQVEDITNMAEEKFGAYVEQAAAQSQNTLGGLLGRGFDMLNSQINHGVANNDLKNALNSLTGSFQDSANQALGQNSDLSLNSIGQQVGGQVLNEANNKYDLQSKLNQVQAKLN